MTQPSDDQVLDELRERWHELGILHGEGASEQDLAAFEVRHGVILPADLRRYFATVNGTALGQYGMDDPDLLGFWHLDQVHTFAEEHREPDSDDLDEQRTFAVADYSIWCYGFGIQLSSDRTAPTPVVTDISKPYQQIAESFTAFVRAYLRGEESTIYPDPVRD